MPGGDGDVVVAALEAKIVQHAADAVRAQRRREPLQHHLRLAPRRAGGRAARPPRLGHLGRRGRDALASIAAVDRLGICHGGGMHARASQYGALGTILLAIHRDLARRMRGVNFHAPLGEDAPGRNETSVERRAGHSAVRGAAAQGPLC